MKIQNFDEKKENLEIKLKPNTYQSNPHFSEEMEEMEKEKLGNYIYQQLEGLVKGAIFPTRILSSLGEFITDFDRTELRSIKGGPADDYTDSKLQGAGFSIVAHLGLLAGGSPETIQTVLCIEGVLNYGDVCKNVLAGINYYRLEKNSNPQLDN